MDKGMHSSEKMSMENNAANQESDGEMFVRRVASSGLVLKFKVDKYGTLPSKHTISSQEVTTSCSAKANKMEHPVIEDGNNESMVHTCNECGKGFKEISSLHGHKGIHRREENKRMRMMAEKQPITVEASHVVSPQEKNKDPKKKILFAAWTLDWLSMEFKQYRLDDLSASMACSNKHIGAVEETEDMREVAEILSTLAQSFCKDTTVHVSSSASTVERFVCTTCKRTFSSYHALGGHRSCHNNKPTKNSFHEDGGAGSSSGDKDYECDKCKEKFPNGQILGGHKHKHWWEEHYKKQQALLEAGNVKPQFPILPNHEAGGTSGLVAVPTDENIRPAGTGLVVAAQTVPLACDAVQNPQQVMSLGNEIEKPVPPCISDEDVA